jgi:uncharacterized protein YbjT (DUF2867 family)
MNTLSNLVLLFGGSGHVGKAIAHALQARGYRVRAVVRSEAAKAKLSALVEEVVMADVADKSQLAPTIFEGVDFVVSALGKSVSPSDRSEPTFQAIDFQLNKNILEAAQGFSIRKMVYVSAWTAEQNPHLVYFRVHEDFAQLLRASGLPYAIVKPTGVFSAFAEMLDLASKNQMMVMGNGLAKTNPIHESDVAEAVVNALLGTQKEIGVGGEEVLTRRQIAELAQKTVGNERPLRAVPVALFRIVLPVLRLFSRNMYDKFAFFLAVNVHDAIAPKVGKKRLADYLAEQWAARQAVGATNSQS